MSSDETMSDLARYAVGRPWWRWMRGMTWHAEDVVTGETYEGVVERPHAHSDPQSPGVWRDGRPDLSDPATVGCLWALAEEVCGGPVEAGMDARTGLMYARVCIPGSRKHKGPTRAEALIALMDGAHAAQGGQDEQ